MGKENNKIVMLWGDIHLPYHHPDAFDFLKAVKKKYKPTRVICMGDLVDNHAISYHESDPDLPSARDELEMAKFYMEELYMIFPKLDILQGNHDKLPIRKAKSAGLSSRYIKNNHEVFNMPKDWKWEHELILTLPNYGDLWLRHYFTTNIIDLAIKNNINMAQGHLHSKSDCTWIMNKDVCVWALTVGCLVDDKSLAMEYNKLDKYRPVLSVTIIKNGIPKIIFMNVDKDNNWDGKI